VNRRALTVMVLVVALGATGLMVSTSSANAEIVGSWGVTYRDSYRGFLNGKFLGVNLIQSATVYGIRLEVCDVVDEPEEDNVVRGQVMAAFTNGISWIYRNSGWMSAPGDGGGCARLAPINLWTTAVGFSPSYIRITVEAPGKATAVFRAGF
jgi:hypothetical protein